MKQVQPPHLKNGFVPGLDQSIQIFINNREAYFDSLRRQGYEAAHEKRVRRVLTQYIFFLNNEVRVSSQNIYSTRMIQTYAGWKNETRLQKPYPEAYRFEIKRFLNLFLNQYVHATRTKLISRSRMNRRIEKFIGEREWPSRIKSDDIQNRIRRFFEYLERIDFTNYRHIKAPIIEAFIVEEESKLDGYKKTYSLFSIRLMVTEIKRYLRFLSSNKLIDYPDGLKPKKPRHLLDDTMDRYIEFCIDARGLAPSTITLMRDAFHQLAEHLKKLEITQLSAIQMGHIESYIATRKFSPKSLSTHYSMLRRFFKYLFIEKMIPRDIGELLIGPRIFSLAHIPKYLSHDELKLLFQEKGELSQVEIRDQAIVYLILYTGLRSEEVSGLLLDEVHWDKKQIVIRNRKNRLDHLQVLPDPAIQAIYNYILKVRPTDRSERRLFFTLRAPIIPMSPVAVTNAVGSYFDSRGIDGQAHRLRHTHAQILLDSGSSLKEVQHSLGHSAGGSVEIYTKTSMERMRKYIVVER
jgi:site-specific recombinase XerD